MSLEQQEGERKLVSVLFADIAGFTALSETMDAEPVRDLLNDLYDQLVPVIERYEGTVDKFMGDCLMAVFGAPTAHEDDAERSVRAGIDMRSTLARFNGERGLNLSIHIGINTGRVIAGAVGGRGRWDYSVIGDAVNVASRLEEASAPGDILIGPDTHRLTSHAFLDESAGIIDVRGRSEAVPIYRLLGQRPRVARKRSAGRVDASLVGRYTEMEMLRSALAGLTLGVGGALFLLGEAGVGKSRLVAEARADTAFASIRWLEGRALSYEETTGYPPFKEIIETDAQIDVADGHVERQHKAALRVSALLPAEAESVSQHVTGILGTGIPGDFAERLRYMNDDAVRTEFLGAIRSYFGALARKSPVVLVFEDAHWLDPRSGRLVQELIPLARTHAVLFCFVARSGPHRAVLDSMDCARNALRSRFHEIHVMPLTAIDTAELAKNLLPGAEIPTTVNSGNPKKG